MKITISLCPHCNKVIDFKTEGGAGVVQDFGQATIVNCSKCGKPVSNGLKEWPELTIMKKGIAIFRIIYTSLFYGVITGVFALVAFSLVYGTDDRILSRDDLIMIVTVMLAFSAAFCFVITHRFLKEIELSAKRAREKYEKNRGRPLLNDQPS